MSRLAALAAGRVVAIVAAVVGVLLIVGTVYVLQRGSTKEVTAHFPRTVGLYEGSDVRVLGVPVGKVTKIKPEGTSVAVTMQYAASRQVPSDAKAIIVPPSVVSDRYVQLSPAYTGGPVLADNADIPLDRTATPVELDEIYANLNQLNVALGPKGANSNGALNDLLQVSARNLDGQGENFHNTIEGFSKAVTTLSESRTNLFQTMDNLQTFTTALAANDAQVRAFNSDLASVAGQLNGEKEELAAAVKNLSVALGQVAGFVQQNKDIISKDVADLGDITGTLVKQKEALTEFISVAPTALSNLGLAGNAAAGTLDTRGTFGAQDNPALFICSLLSEAGAAVPGCTDVLSGITPPSGGGAPTAPGVPGVGGVPGVPAAAPAADQPAQSLLGLLGGAK